VGSEDSGHFDILPPVAEVIAEKIDVAGIAVVCVGIIILVKG
jgi:hypothetical protein